MGYDNLSIVSFNSARKGLLTLSPGQRPTYLQRLFESAEPDICFLPWDDKYSKLNVIRGYGQFTIPHNEDTVLLYNSNKVSMKNPQVSLTAFGQLPGLDLDKIVVPQVEVFTQQPVQTVVKEFNMVSWRCGFFESARVQAERLVESIIIFSQRLTLTTQRPVLIGGEMKIDYAELMKIIKKLSHVTQDEFLTSIKDEMSEHKFLPSMTKASMTDLRHLFMMKVFRCKQNNANDIVKTWENNQSEPVPDCFIASKQLHLEDASLLDVEKVTGRAICMPLLKVHKPTHTHMEIPVRPPKHHGG